MWTYPLPIIQSNILNKPQCLDPFLPLLPWRTLSSGHWWGTGKPRDIPGVGPGQLETPESCHPQIFTVAMLLSSQKKYVSVYLNSRSLESQSTSRSFPVSLSSLACVSPTFYNRLLGVSMDMCACISMFPSPYNWETFSPQSTEMGRSLLNGCSELHYMSMP